MSRIEKTILGAMAALIIGLIFSVSYSVNSINEAGGVKALIIDAGKEIKDIGEKIAEE